jgi:hypothetical protein
MKKFLLTISAVLLVCSVAAQFPADRTAQTVIADALAQIPAKDRKQYDQLMKDLAATGEEGILSLTSKLNAPGKGSNAAVEYALSGIAHYVGGAGDENLRATISNACVKALNATDIKENRQFIISLLQIAGKDEAVEALAPLLGNPDLSDNAARALASIKTEKAGKALQTALLRKMGTPETLRNIVLAIGEAQTPDSEKPLLTLLPTDDEALKKDVLWALSRTGGAAAITALAAEAEKTGFGYEKTNATEAYLALLWNIKDAESAREVSAASLKILKTAPENAYTARIAALRLYTRTEREFNEEKVWKEIITALKSDNKPYRVAALENTVWLQRSAVKDNDKTLKKLLKKEKDPERQSELIHAAADIAFAEIKQAGTVSGRCGGLFAAIQPYLQSENPSVRITAMREIGSLASAYPDHGDIRQLVSALDSEDKDVIRTGVNVLKSIKSDKVTGAINDLILQVNDNTKIAYLDVIASRKATQSLANVLSLIRSGSPEVKTAALKALKDVVTVNDLEMLASMAESADRQAIPYIQQAGMAALSSLPADQQISLIKEGMSRAGAKKYLYYLPLASTGDPQAIAPIKEGFASGSKDVKDAAFDALLNWNGADAANLIFDVCKDPAAGEYFDRALDTYITKISNSPLSVENKLIFLRKAMETAKTDAQKNRILKQIEQTGTYLALLYAGEFLDIPALKENAAQAVMNIALNHREYTGENVVSLLNRASAALSSSDADYQRQSIRKHLEALPRDKGFVSLFNGKDLTGWKGLLASPNDNPLKRAKLKPKELAAEQVKADEQMRRDWVVENGLLAYVGHSYNNLCTDRKYGDFEMYVDWMLDPAGPEADAGIYLRGTPQVQIWDIARTNVGAQVGSGGLYNNQVHPNKPLKLADNKLGEWNTMYIRMIGDRVTVKLNGVPVVDNVILENYWDRNLPLPDFEQIELQAHGSKVYYRNIYVKELERPKPFELPAQEKKEGFKILFDGTNMHEWTGNMTDYQLEDGCISVHPGSSFGGNLYTKKEYANFAFRFEFQLTPAANNGVGIRALMEGDNAYNAMEIQILDCEHPVYKNIEPYQHHGSVYGVIAAEHGFMKPVGEWNEEEIYANGDHIRVTLNGKVILDGNIRDASKNGTLDHKQHPGLFNKSGHIGFLGHGNELKFRNIRIKEL